MTHEGTPTGAGAGDGPELRARAAKGVFWTATGNWGEQLAALVVFAILARLLVPEAFGLVALAAVFVGLAQVIASQGLSEALVQRKDLEPAHLDSAFWMSVAFGLVFAAILAALAYPIALLFDQPTLAPILVALAMAIPITASAVVQRGILMREMAFRSLALRSLIATGVGGVLGVGAAFLGFGVWSLVVQHLALQITAVVVLWRVSAWRPRFRFSYAHSRDLFSFGIHVVGFRLLGYLNRRVDHLIIGGFLGPVSLGYYTIGTRMVLLITKVSVSLIDRVAFPLYSRIQAEPKRLRRAYYKSSAFASIITFPMFLALLVLAPEVISVFFGPQWTESVPVMQVLTLVGIVRAFTYLNSSVLMARGKPSWRVAITAVTTILSVVAFLLVVQRGIVAVAVATVCVGYVVAPITYWAVGRLVPVDLRGYLRQIWAPLVAACVMAGAMFGVQELLADARAFVTLVVATGVGIGVYVATFHVIARALAAEARGLVRDALRLPRVVGSQRRIA